VVAAAVGLRWLGVPEPQWNMYRTGKGALQSLTLADGSSVTLNTDSELHVQASGATRSVRLIHGEALFTVKHDPGRLFEVALGNIRVKDIGTEFSIRRLNDLHAQVLVKEGKVRIERVAAAPGGQSRTAASALRGSRCPKPSPSSTATTSGSYALRTNVLPIYASAANSTQPTSTASRKR
jgi:ferric-dicitrate binding protein FerR (iron transport regulator)